LMARSRHVVITGAGGFIGGRLSARLMSDPDFRNDRLTLVDVRLDVPAAGAGSRARRIEGDLTDSAVLDAIFSEPVDILIHLAAILGGAAEASPGLARRVNVDATLDLFQRARRPERPVRIVYASSVAVFGPPLGDHVGDDTMPVATMIYGAQKRMVEIALEHESARGWIDGIAVRLPGIVASRDADARMKSAFFNTIFYDYAAGKRITLPVSPGGTTWLISVPACIDAFIHAAALPAARLSRRRAFTLPAQRVTISELVEALGRRYPESGAQVQYAPDEALDSQFARLPPLTTAIGDALGFVHDGDIDRLVERATAE
jgi:nucleoside-diphosphate-sugar epimerase